MDATVRGTTYRFVNAHVENEGLMAPDGTVVQEAQVAELLHELAHERLPVFLVGDFNLPPGDPDYKAIVAAGFTDLWAARTNGRPKEGNTCCQDEDLLNEETTLTERLDYLFARHHRRPGSTLFHYPVIVQLTGNDADEDKTESGLWPSDHAGVFAAVRLRDGRRSGSAIPPVPQLLRRFRTGPRPALSACGDSQLTGCGPWHTTILKTPYQVPSCGSGFPQQHGDLFASQAHRRGFFPRRSCAQPDRGRRG